MLEQEATSSHRRILSRQTILKNQNDTLEKLDNSLAANNKQMNSQVALGLASGSQLKDLEMKELSSLKIDENNRNSSQNEIETSPAKTGKEDFDLKKKILNPKIQILKKILDQKILTNLIFLRMNKILPLWVSLKK
jgi:hypothetical protein